MVLGLHVAVGLFLAWQFVIRSKTL